MRKLWILIGVAALIAGMALTGCPIEEEKEKVPDIETVAIVGNVTGWPADPGGVDTDAKFKFTKGSDGIYTWTGQLDRWMKFYANDAPQGEKDGTWLAPNRTDADEDVDCELNVPVTKDFGIFRNEEHDKKAWHILNAGKYKIDIDLNKLKATFTLIELEPEVPYDKLDAIWLVGPSTAVGDYDGWKMPNGGNTNIMATTDKVTYTWTGALELSADYDGNHPGVGFVTDFNGKEPDWGSSIWFVANTNEGSGSCQAVTPGTTYDLVKKETGGNNNYNLFDITDAGNYIVTITLNPPADGSTSAKVKFEKN
jgi:hypothetical protein